MKRRKMDQSHSEKLFRNTANRAHPKNTQNRPMRGGNRL